jgi:hypothetical protein
MAFYQCEKCKLTWQYPIEICPYCFDKTKEIAGKTSRVIGVSKVNLTTLNHPKAPYFILLLQDENGNMWAQKSEKEQAIGDEYKTEPVLDKFAVAVWKVKYNQLEAVKKTVELIGGVKTGKTAKVLILPTASKPSHYYFRDNTSPAFFEAALNFLLEAGVLPENITIGTQSFDEIPVAAIAQKSGLLEVCQKHKIIPKDLAAGVFEKKGKFEVAKDALEANLVLNLAMLKIGQAAAAQNLFRVLKKENYLGLKYLESEAQIARGFDILEGKVLTLADGEFTQRPTKLTTFTGLTLAGRNAMNVDLAFNVIAESSCLPEILEGMDIGNVPIAGRSLLETQFKAELY